MSAACLRAVTLIEPSRRDLPGYVVHDRETALRDLAEDSCFHPEGAGEGPFTLEISIEDSRLVLRMQDAGGADLPMLVLSVRPYKRLIQDYFIIVNSFERAQREGHTMRLEAIDMGRRGLHNEGASLLMERLTGKIEMDHPTARRLFTLICVLHAEKAWLWQ